MPRRLLIAGNWKMNKTVPESIKLITEIKRDTYDVSELDILVCPPFTVLCEAQEVLEGSNIYLGGQNMHFEAGGAYTGEISPLMLKDLGCKYVILGHSERRNIFLEDDKIINKKLKTALKSELIPILCVGETLKEREEDKTFNVIEDQLRKCLEGVEITDAAGIVIAYEPVWAIGTGRNATSKQAQEVHSYIRSLIKEILGYNIYMDIRIIYGGSVKPDNIKELIKESDVDGALVGGASLDAESFTQIIKISSKESL